MAKNNNTVGDDNNLIGYDPLAWMTEELLEQETVAEEENTISVQEFEVIKPSGSIKLEAVLNIQNVTPLHEKLKNSVAANDLIEIEVSDVTSIDTTTLQLLVALKKESIKLQKIVIFINPSPRFLESAKLLGLLEILDV
jgi:anti-anti-sigma regulatory factor